MAKHIFTGAGAPNFIPEDVGHHYVDTVTKDAYLSVGKTSAADWVIAAGTSAGGQSVVDSMAGDEADLAASVRAVKAYLKLFGTLQAKTITEDIVIPDGMTWIRGETVLEGDVTVTALGDSTIHFL